jgi:hypothetical protein
MNPIQEDPSITQDYESQSQAFQAHKTQENDYWKNAWNTAIATPRYKPDPRLAEIKRKEAILKNLFAGMGTLFADKTRVQDYRQDIYQTRNHADAIEQNERAKEAASNQQYLDKLHQLFTSRPRHEEDVAQRLLKEYRAGIRKQNAIEQNKWWLQLKKQEFDAAENQKNRDAQKARADAANTTRLKAGEKETPQKPYSNVYIDLNDGMGKRSIPLDQGKFAYLASIIANKKGYNLSSQEANNDPDIQLLQHSMGDGNVSKSAWEQLLAKYPDLIRDALREMVYGTTENETAPPQNSQSAYSPQNSQIPYSPHRPYSPYDPQPNNPLQKEPTEEEIETFS